MVRKIACLLLGLGTLLSSCTQATVHTTSTLMPTGALTPYRTQTATAILSTATIKVTIPVTPSPTPTPFLHTVTNDDTMLGLAIRYGVKLEDLKAANPGVNPNAMSVGSQLVIPINEVVPDVAPTATAMPMQLRQPRCYESGEGGAWCVAALTNNLEQSVENLSVWIGLYNQKGENFTSQVAYAALDILRPGDTIPLMAYFSAPLPEDFTSQAELLSAFPVAADDSRYLDAEIRTDRLQINQDGSQAVVNGEVILTQGSQAPSQVWLLAVAYSANGDILGARKWKSMGETRFKVTVYSLGGEIDRVEVLAQITP